MIDRIHIDWVYWIERYRTVTNVVGTVLVGWILSAMVSQFIGLFLPDAPLVGSASTLSAPTSLADSTMNTFGMAQRLEDYMPICKRNIFDSQKRAICEAEVTSETQSPVIDMDSAPQKSDIGATLVGTMVSTNPSRSFATIQPKNGKGPENYYIDQMLMDEGKIYDVQRNRVFFVRNGHREFLEVENLPNIYVSSRSNAETSAPTNSGVRLEGDKAILSRAKVESTLGDLNNIIQQARMVPNFNGSAVDGFKVFAIQPGSIFQELGLKNGDVIQRINGTDVNSVEKAIPMLQLLRSESSISLDITRGGAKKSMSIEIR